MRCSASEMFVLNNVRSYPEMYRISVYSFMKRLHSSVNLIIMTIASSDFYCESTLLVLCVTFLGLSYIIGIEGVSYILAARAYHRLDGSVGML